MCVSFLFGSGADTDACDKLKSGQSFAEVLLKNKYCDEIKSITGFDASYFRLIYPTSCKVFIQTIVNNEFEAKEIFGDTITQNFKDYHYGKKGIDFGENIRPKCQEWYRLIENSANSKEKDFFLKNAVFFDSLDEKFNSLRYTDYNSNAKRIINAYLSVFLEMFKSLYDIPKEFDWKYENIFSKLKQKYDSVLSDSNYYNILSKSNLKYDVATTNYTDIVNYEINTNIAFLHGKLTWFEDLEKLTIYDCTQENDYKNLLNSKHIIPYILIPSGIKPLICEKQILEFGKFINDLNKNQILVVVGYKFNTEDNHINSIIADWLNKSINNRMLLLNYNSDIDLQKFKCFSNFEIDNKEFDKIKEQLISNKKIVNIITNKENSRNAFKKILEELEELTNCVNVMLC